MSDAENYDYLTGEVGENTGYTAVKPGRYKAVLTIAEFVDPVAMGWEPAEDVSEADREDFLRPFPRVRFKIESLENGDVTEYAGRMVDFRLSLRSGPNPKTGRSFAEGRAQLMRLANGLGPKDEVTGLKLLDCNLAGLDREEAVRVATENLKKYEGLRATVRVINIKNKKSGEMRESVGAIVL
jgi:hypothetical protein